MSNEQRIIVLKQEIYYLVQAYIIAFKKYRNEKDPIIKKILYDSIIKLCEMDKEKRKTLSKLENIVKKKKEEDKGIRYCYVRLYNPFVDYDKLKNLIIIGDSLHHSTIPGIRLKETPRKSIIGPKTKHIDDPLPILCKSIDNERLFDLVTGEEYVLIDKYDCSKQTIEYKDSFIDINPKALTNILAFTISECISEDAVLGTINSLDETQRDKYASRINQLKELVNESYNEYLNDSSNKNDKVKFVNMRKLMR